MLGRAGQRRRTEDLEVAGRLEPAPVATVLPVPEAARVGRQHHQPAPGTQDAACLAQQADWIRYVLDEVSHGDRIERSLRVTLIRQAPDPYVQPARAGGLHGRRIEVHALHRPAQLAQRAERAALATSDVEQATAASRLEVHHELIEAFAKSRSDGSACD